MTAARKPEVKPGFEDSLKRLEEIVERLEQGEVPLDESLRMYEEGVRLSRECMQFLQDAELRIQKLTKDTGGGLALADYDMDGPPEHRSARKDAQ
jgi:exodeoxyribonuclease VII small subunit